MQLGIYLKKDDYKLDSRTLLKKVLSQFFGDVRCAEAKGVCFSGGGSA